MDGHLEAAYSNTYQRTSHPSTIILHTHGRDQVCHSSASRRITALQKPSDTSGVCHSLNSKLAGSTETTGEVVEEQWSDGRRVSHIAGLGCAASIDH